MKSIGTKLLPNENHTVYTTMFGIAQYDDYVNTTNLKTKNIKYEKKRKCKNMTNMVRRRKL